MSVLVAILSSIVSLTIYIKYKAQAKKAEIDLMTTIRRQQGMTLKYIKQGDHYIYTLMEGQLLGKMGLTSAMVTGKNLHEFYSKQDADTIEQAYSKAWNGEITDYEAHLNGIDYFVTLSPVIKHGKVVEVIGSGVDISERKKSEKILHMSLALRRTLIDSLEIGMVVIDDDRKIIALNRKWCQLFKFEGPIQKIIGKDVFEQMAFFFENNEVEKKKLNDLLVNQKPAVDEVEHFENRIFKRSYFPFYMDGELKGHIWAIEDINERKAMERGIIETKEEAVKANKAKSEFLARMSHELRTPLNGILGFSQLLELEETLNAKQQQFVREILKGGRHLLTLINDSLDLSAIESGKIKLALDTVKIDEIINECIKLIAPLADKKGISIAFEQNGNHDWYVFADKIRLRQIFLNLLDNAIKYNRENGKVSIHWDKRDDILFVHMVDTGIGIPDSEQKSIFEPFYRSDHTQGEGIGMGLALVSQLIQVMGGKVGVESRIGEGSDFWISLPLVNAQVAIDRQLMEGERPALLQGHNFTILYIEDNLLNLQLVIEILGTIQGISLISAMTGSEGMELAAEWRPDLILLDLNLPDLHGYEVFDRIKANPAYEQTPIIALSANAMPEEINQALGKGFAEYICKPIEIPAFLTVLSKHLS